MSQDEIKAPVMYRIPLWYGFGLAGIYLIYGGVKIVLSFLDHNFIEMSALIFFAVLGLVLLAVVIAYQKIMKSGWYGLIGIGSLVIIVSLMNIFKSGNGQSLLLENILMIIITSCALYALFSAQTKSYLNKFN